MGVPQPPLPPALLTTTDDVTGPLRPPAQSERLWTPWRMRYVGGGAKEEGCLFCNRLAAGDDVRSLILRRGDRAFVMMNLFPYNTGHVMIVPTAHVASPEDADPTALTEMATLLPLVTRVSRRVLRCDGFNVGFNVGAIAGAGVAGHLHQHVVPRWVGDANFMPIIASTMVLPELIPVTYAKLRAELARDTAPGGPNQRVEVPLVVLDGDLTRVLLLAAGRSPQLPTAAVAPDEPVWQASRQRLDDLLADAELVGWAGANRASDGAIALAFRAAATTRLDPSAAFLPLDEAKARLPDERARQAIDRALAGLAPGIAAP